MKIISKFVQNKIEFALSKKKLIAIFIHFNCKLVSEKLTIY